MSNTNPLDILKRLDIKQNVTIRVIEEATNKVVQEHVGHNAATNSMLTGIAHYLLGDGTLNQGSDMLTSWVPQYISLGTMGLTSQDSENIGTEADPIIVPAGIGTTLPAPSSATEEEKRLNAQLRFTEYLNQCPGFGADGYDENTNNDRAYFGLGLPYDDRPVMQKQDFFDGDGENRLFTLSQSPRRVIIDNTEVAMITSVTIYPPEASDTFSANGGLDYKLSKPALSIITVKLNNNIVSSSYYDLDTENNTVTFHDISVSGKLVITYEIVSVINQDMHDTSVTRQTLPSNQYHVENDTVIINDNVTPPVVGSRIAIIYEIDATEAAVCELIDSTTLRSKINFRNIIPEVQSEVPGTLDVIFSAFLSTGQLSKYRGDNDYIYITEAGLWSKPSYNNSGDNGLLAGYRLMPSDDQVNTLGVEDKFNSDGTITDFVLSKKALQIDSVTLDNDPIPKSDYILDTTNNSLKFVDEAPSVGQLIVVYRTSDTSGTWKDMSVKENRELVQKNIIRIGEGQVAQIIWKLQLGGLEQLEGLRYLYPSQYPKRVWIVWNS